MALFSAVVTICSATRCVETRGSRFATLFHDFSVARTLFSQGLVHVQSDQTRLIIAVDIDFGSGSSASALAFITSVLVDAPILTSRGPLLFGGEESVVVASGNVVAYHSTRTQHLGSLDVAHGAFWGTSAECFSAFDSFAGVGHNAPTSTGRSVTLSRLVVSIIRACWDEFAGHEFASVLSRLRARSDGSGAL